MSENADKTGPHRCRVFDFVFQAKGSFPFSIQAGSYVVARSIAEKHAGQGVKLLLSANPLSHSKQAGFTP